MSSNLQQRAIQPIGKAGRKAIGNVLDNQNARVEICRKLLQKLQDRLRAAGRGSDVQANAAAYVEVRRVDGGGELVAAAADEAWRGDQLSYYRDIREQSRSYPPVLDD